MQLDCVLAMVLAFDVGAFCRGFVYDAMGYSNLAHAEKPAGHVPILDIREQLRQLLRVANSCRKRELRGPKGAMWGRWI